MKVIVGELLPQAKLRRIITVGFAQTRKPMLETVLCTFKFTELDPALQFITHHDSIALQLYLFPFNVLSLPTALQELESPLWRVDSGVLNRAPMGFPSTHPTFFTPILCFMCR